MYYLHIINCYLVSASSLVLVPTMYCVVSAVWILQREYWSENQSFPWVVFWWQHNLNIVSDQPLIQLWSASNSMKVEMLVLAGIWRVMTLFQCPSDVGRIIAIRQHSNYRWCVVPAIICRMGQWLSVVESLSTRVHESQDDVIKTWFIIKTWSANLHAADGCQRHAIANCCCGFSWI